MIARLVASAVVSVSLVLAGPAWGAGRDYSPDQVAAKGPLAVHGYWLNWTDVVFYKGDTAAFNEFLAKASQNRNALPLVTVHEGTLEARSPWPSKAGAKPADWSAQSLDQNASISGIDVWLGGQVEKEKIFWPEGIVPQDPLPLIDLPAQEK